MPEVPNVGPTRPSAPEFLAAVERSGVLSESTCRDLLDRFGRTAVLDDSLTLAYQLVKEGTLTEFQARWLLKGKKGLAFGRYVLLDHIGQGAMGRVFKARHRLMDRVVALKVLLLDQALSETSFARFSREMKIVALLDHPNVVRAIDADVHEGCPYIVMEYLEGYNLEKILARRGPLPPEEVAECMAQVSRGLAHAHEKGVIHRDVKPTNVFLVNTGTAKLLDLGFGELAGMAGQAGNVFDTDEGTVVGTTDFMSPEQVKNKPIDARTDLFSLGCTMYRLLTGAYAFPGLTREDRLVKRIRERHVPITDIRPGLPPSLVAVVDRLLALSPGDRFGSAAEAAEALDALSPASSKSDRGTNTKPGAKSPAASSLSLAAEPDVAVDWSLIESALRATRQGALDSARLPERNAPRSPSTKGISSHRRVLEEEGVESGRKVHEKYRSELIQMKRAMAELKSTGSNEAAPPAGAAWLERIGEFVGDSLAEPTALQILIAILALLLVLALALAYALE
jgi:serine/threonine protein kinase